MRVGILFFGGTNRGELLNITNGLARGIESQGFDVDLIDGDRDVNLKLTIYGYIAVGTVAESTFGGKIPAKIAQYLATSGMVSGKRCFAYILKKGFRQMKTLKNLMMIMEREGMFLKFSEVLGSTEEAEAVGKRLHIK